MRFDINYDEKGRPVHVNTDDGFAMISRSFDPKEDGWMLDQLDPADFPMIRAGREMEALVREVNMLRRENFRLRQSEKDWMRASGFGGES